jgi:hypothetical protein
VYDSCGSGYFEARKGYRPDLAALNAMLEKDRIDKRVRFTMLVEVEEPRPQAVYELMVRGLG